MTKGLLCAALSAMALVVSIAVPLQSDAMAADRRPDSARGHHQRPHVIVYHRRIVLPPERHVIEKVRPPYSGNFIINATRFTAKTPACARWVAGERIKLLAGDWHGFCVDAVFYNVPRREVCELACR
jgi:hypothetical protein